MKRRSRSLTRTEPYLRFLKPGALARLRDSRISSKSHRFNSLLQIALHRFSPPSSPLPDAVNTMDGSPCFSRRIYGPRCPQRKRLMATKTVLFLSSRPSSVVLDSSDPIISSFNSVSVVVAH